MNTKTETTHAAPELPSADSLANKHCKANVKEAEPTWLCEAVGFALPDWKILVESIEPEAAATEATATATISSEATATDATTSEAAANDGTASETAATEAKVTDATSKLPDEATTDSAQVPAFKAARAIALERTFSFDNYYQTVSFVNSIASMIHREDHHPQLTVTFNRCVVRWDTHTVKGISLNDLICAAKCDVVFGAGAHTKAK
jgi:4a-hydroxytetrahydrobiopterin dehydratase